MSKKQVKIYFFLKITKSRKNKILPQNPKAFQPYINSYVPHAAGRMHLLYQNRVPDGQ